jgi:hypothetical protein
LYIGPAVKVVARIYSHGVKGWRSQPFLWGEWTPAVNQQERARAGFSRSGVLLPGFHPKSLSYLWVALVVRSAAHRFWLSGLVAARYGDSFPTGTLVVNVSGSLVIRLLAALGPGRTTAPSPGLREFHAGVAGGIRRWFSLQT